MSDLELEELIANHDMLAARVQKLQIENERLREALEDLLDDNWVLDFGEWFEARLKQAQTALTREDNRT
jgi:hypothetical protein